MMKRKSILVLLIVLCGLIASFLTIGKATAEAPEPSPEEQYNTAMEQWLDKLQWEETRTNPMLVILDVNNKYSYGCLQFQAATWAAQSKKYGVTEEIMDCQAQRRVAKKMIADDWKAWRNWYTSVAKKNAGYPPEKPI